MTSSLSLWLIPVLPLAGAAINGFLGKKSSRTAVSVVGLFFSGAAFAWALTVALRFSSFAFPCTGSWTRVSSGRAGVP